MLETVLSFSDLERALPPTTEISELIFVVNKLKYNNAFRVSILQNRRNVASASRGYIFLADNRLNPPRNLDEF